jgi:hypothetical protein
MAGRSVASQSLRQTCLRQAQISMPELPGSNAIRASISCSIHTKLEQGSVRHPCQRTPHISAEMNVPNFSLKRY